MATSSKSVKRVRKQRRKTSYMPPPNSLKNLIPYQKGMNGNNGGNGYSLTAELKHALNKEKRLEFVNSTIEGAILREPTPFRELWDRVEGKLTDTPVIRDVNVVFVIGKGYRDLPQLNEGKDGNRDKT